MKKKILSQNKITIIYKKKIQTVMVNNSTNINKMNNHNSPLKSLNTNKTKTYDMGSQPSPPLDKINWTSKGKYKYKQTLKKLQIFATTQKG